MLSKKNTKDLNRKELEQELILYQTMVNASLESITFIDRSYTYRIVNDAYIKARYLKKEDIINHTVADVWGEEVFVQILKDKLDDCFQGKPYPMYRHMSSKKMKLTTLKPSILPALHPGKTSLMQLSYPIT